MLITTILCFFVYKISFKEKNTLVALGDSFCLAKTKYGARITNYNYYLGRYLKATINDDFCSQNYKASELLSDIINNKTINNKTILNTLDNAKYITLMIGLDELTTYKIVDNVLKKEFISNYSRLLKLLNDNTKATIIVIGFLPNYFQNYLEINKKIENMCKNLNIIYVDSSTLVQNSQNFFDSKTPILSKFGNHNMYRLIKEKI